MLSANPELYWCFRVCVLLSFPQLASVLSSVLAKFCPSYASGSSWVMSIVACVGKRPSKVQLSRFLCTFLFRKCWECKGVCYGQLGLRTLRRDCLCLITFSMFALRFFVFLNLLVCGIDGRCLSTSWIQTNPALPPQICSHCFRAASSQCS